MSDICGCGGGNIAKNEYFCEICCAECNVRQWEWDNRKCYKCKCFLSDMEEEECKGCRCNVCDKCITKCKKCKQFVCKVCLKDKICDDCKKEMN
jgi:hypothetical protein